MSVSVAKEFVKDSRMMRDVYCATLMDMAEADERVVSLDADLMKSMGMIPFLEKYPDRTFNCGVQEANMIGVAAGLSATGQDSVRAYVWAVCIAQMLRPGIHIGRICAAQCAHRGQ